MAISTIYYSKIGILFFFYILRPSDVSFLPTSYPVSENEFGDAVAKSFSYVSKHVAFECYYYSRLLTIKTLAGTGEGMQPAPWVFLK